MNGPTLVLNPRYITRTERRCETIVMENIRDFGRGWTKDSRDILTLGNLIVSAVTFKYRIIGAPGLLCMRDLL